MKLRACLAACALAAGIVGCTTVPTPVMPAENDYELEPSVTTPSAPMVESPPIEPVEPLSEPPAAATPSPPAQSAPPASAPSAAVAVGAPANGASAPEPTEDQQMLALLADLQRFGTLPADELKRELSAATQALGRQRTDVNRVRLAVLYTLLRASPQDDQRALQLFENVAKNAAASPPIRQLAAVLQTQVVERQRAVRDEQQKADAAIQKLEALRAMERSLLRDRVRSGGGGGGGGSAGGSGR
ncbi:MAG TPA: hypothetical protein VF059_11660 [Casimicrobiaceae bacterium]